MPAQKYMASYKIWAAANPGKLAAANRRYFLKTRAVMRAHKAQPCVDCGIQYPYYVMQFDHVRGKKLFNIASISKSTSIKRVLEEIAKCDVVCANCHAARTYRRITASEGGNDL